MTDRPAVALKIKHSMGPDGSYGKEILEQHFVMPRSLAEGLKDSIEKVLASLPPKELNG